MNLNIFQIYAFTYGSFWSKVYWKYLSLRFSQNVIGSAGHKGEPGISGAECCIKRNTGTTNARFSIWYCHLQLGEIQPSPDFLGYNTVLTILTWQRYIRDYTRNAPNMVHIGGANRIFPSTFPIPRKALLQIAFYYLFTLLFSPLDGKFYIERNYFLPLHPGGIKVTG